ncbi:TetR family transcriptional regulator [Roseibium sp.]|uniref:LmrA/YxaF family transcription factor n=1 Tax=Roseibium sp. TaxID=1936156 RepID=UPI003A9784F9
MSGRTNDPRGMRRKITRAAFELFARDGYNATAMQSVRNHAGVSSGAFAHHFPTKHELGLAVIQEDVTAAIASTWIAPIERAATAREGVEIVFRSIIGDIEAAGGSEGCPLGNLAAELSTQDAAFRSALQEIFESWTSAITRKLRSDAKGTSLTDEELASLADFVVAAFTGGIIMAKASRSAAALRASLKPVLRSLQVSQIQH